MNGCAKQHTYIRYNDQISNVVVTQTAILQIPLSRLQEAQVLSKVSTQSNGGVMTRTIQSEPAVNSEVSSLPNCRLHAAPLCASHCIIALAHQNIRLIDGLHIKEYSDARGMLPSSAYIAGA